MNINYLASLGAVIVLFLLAYVGVDILGLQVIFGVFIPYAAWAFFLFGVMFRLIEWGRSPVPFQITTTAGQQQSLPWIKHDKFENPVSRGAIIVRILLEVFLFRSLFRNTKAALSSNKRLTFTSVKGLWLLSLLFHYALLVTLLRHMRFILEPVPGLIARVEALDGFFQVGVPGIMLSGVLLLVATAILLLRRLYLLPVRYISLASDYFPLFLIFGVAFSGILMRHFVRSDMVQIKTLALSLVTFHPVVPEGIDSIFYVHLFLASVLLAYFPFSKLMHVGGIFLSPTRNMAGNSRAVRHANPWNYPVKVRTYREYEAEFREKMIGAGLPVEKE